METFLLSATASSEQTEKMDQDTGSAQQQQQRQWTAAGTLRNIVKTGMSFPGMFCNFPPERYSGLD